VCGAIPVVLSHTSAMQPSLLRELRSQRISIRGRWSTLLRAEPVSTPLALPDALVHLIDSTLDEIFAALEQSSGGAIRRHWVNGHKAPSCTCRRNPFLAYFIAGEQSMREGLVLAQAANAPVDPIDRDASLAALESVLREISVREIEAFCGVCQFRHLALPAAVQSLTIDRW
jgi:hypothetical protein